MVKLAVSVMLVVLLIVYMAPISFAEIYYRKNPFGNYDIYDNHPYGGGKFIGRLEKNIYGDWEYKPLNNGW
jgi:hypothetical protein